MKQKPLTGRRIQRDTNIRPIPDCVIVATVHLAARPEGLTARSPIGGLYSRLTAEGYLDRTILRWDADVPVCIFRPTPKGDRFAHRLSLKEADHVPDTVASPPP